MGYRRLKDQAMDMNCSMFPSFEIRAAEQNVCRGKS